MSRSVKTRMGSLLLAVCLICNLFAGMPIYAEAAASASDIQALELEAQSGEVSIGSAAELIALSEMDFSTISEATITLTADINMSGEEALAPIGGTSPFNGTFNGNGHVIRNLKIASSSVCTGLFGYVGTEGAIKNLGLQDVSVTGKTNTGAIAGVLLGSVTECFVTGAIDGGRYTGGIAGMLHAGSIMNCWVDADFTTTRYGGGLFGGTDYLTQPNPNVETPLKDWTGPITDKDMVIRNNLVMGTNVGNNYASAFFGSMADKTQSSPLEVLEGNVSWMESVTVKSNNYYGPIYAWWAADREDDEPDIENNVYWEGTTFKGKSVTGLENSGIMSGRDADGAVAFVDFISLGFETRTEAELGAQATYEALGWDFTNVWEWDDYLGHPVLQGVDAP
ncbi:MAG: hypothetical protein Q4A39_06215, partial [Eubacteriales bacterium]|nr:hypothetical protein [Eubacteriales bacterium]